MTTFAAEQVFTSRLSGRPLLDSDGSTVGRIRDVVILPTAGREPPRAIGLVATLHRRHIFVNLGRVADISFEGVRLRGGTIDLRRFARRAGEILISELYDRPVVGGAVADIAIAASEHRLGGWEVSAVAVSRGRGLRHHPTTIVPWTDCPELFTVEAQDEQLVELRELHPTDLANAVLAMPLSRRRQLAEALQDEELADVLEEMDEEDQVRFLALLGVERGADVVEEMQPDDAADLLAEMPDEQRERLLAAMETVQAADLRRLLRYDATTAGGLMTSQPLIVTPETPVAEVLAMIRDPEIAVTAAAQVYVCEPPLTTPTGRFLGTVGFQRLLRQPPSLPVGQCVRQSNFVRPDMAESELAARLAGYNLVGVAVCDEGGRLLGAVTVDDVLDMLLPDDWRKKGG